MKDNLFDTKKKISTNIAALKIGITTEFWRVLSDIIKANIEVVTERILSGSEGETKQDIDRLRDKLSAYREILNTPEDLIHKFEDGDKGGVEVDPYEKHKDKDDKENV